MRDGLRLAGFTLLWLVGLKIDWDCPVPHCIMGSRDQWEYQLFFRPQWQSLCTALTAGNCLPLWLCKGTVKESKSHPVALLKTDGKSFSSEISLNHIMCLKKLFILSMAFYKSLFIIDCWYNRSTYPSETLSFNSKEGIMLKYNHFNSPMGWIYIYE